MRETSQPHLTEAPAEAPAPVVPAPSDILSRLEWHAAESGRLVERVDALDKALRREREARRRLAEVLRRERRVARAIAERAQRAEAERMATAEQLESAKKTITASEHALQTSWARLAELERLLAWAQRPAWRKALRRPPAVG